MAKKRFAQNGTSAIYAICICVPANKYAHTLLDLCQQYAIVPKLEIREIPLTASFGYCFSLFVIL